MELTKIRVPLLIDVSVRKENPDRAIAYFDGSDARVYKILVSRLRSEDSVQNAIILIGLMSKLKKLKLPSATEEIERLQKSFPKHVGVSYKKFISLLDDI
jgi:hypothetical protein